MEQTPSKIKSSQTGVHDDLKFGFIMITFFKKK